MSDWEDRRARINASVKLVAKESEITPDLVRFVWFNASRDGESVVRIGQFLGNRKIRAPRGAVAAQREVLIHSPREGYAFLGREWRADLTPLGKRVLWRITEESRK